MRPLINSGLPFRRDQTAEIGLARNALCLAVRDGRLRRPLYGIYVDAQVPDARELRLDCLRLVLPPHGVVCLRSASWVWGVDAFAPDEQGLLTPEYAVPHHRGRMRQPGVRPVELYFSDDEVVELGGIRVTSPRRTAMDLARRLHRPMVLVALDAFTHQELVTIDELRSDLEPLYRFPGIKQARELIALTEPKTESPGETFLRLRLIDAGFPRPEPQIVILDGAGREVWRVDLGYRERRLGLEYDGREFHEGVEAQEHDEARRADLRRRFGWDVYGFHRGHVLGRRPDLELCVGGWLGIEPRRW